MAAGQLAYLFDTFDFWRMGSCGQGPIEQVEASMALSAPTLGPRLISRPSGIASRFAMWRMKHRRRWTASALRR
jgi:hypothetical protein